MGNLVSVKTSIIKVKDDLPRIRQEMGKVKELAESFKKFGQMQPILVNRSFELIAGGRRLAACIEAGIDVQVIFTDTTDNLTMREMELEENIMRKSLTAAEEIKAVAELHAIKQSIYGERGVGNKEGWGMQQTGEVVGKKRDYVTESLELAQALKDFPVLEQCKTKNEMKKAIKGLQRISESVAAAEQYDKAMQKHEDKFSFHHVNCLEFMSTMTDSSVDVLFTDPPYGIDIHDVTINIGGHTGGNISSSGITYDDSYDSSMEIIGKIAIESFRIVKSTGFAFVFCAISNFPMVRTLFEVAGWNCSQRPIIWIKNESGQNNAPSKWMSAGYESLLFARKIDSVIVVEGKVDWIQCPNVIPSQRIHQAEKPVPLIKELLSRVCLPGYTVLDPFAGSASTIEACIELKLIPTGCEMSEEAYAVGKRRLFNYFKQKGEQ
jgi:DNA modification methylase